MAHDAPETVICRYRVKPGKEADMEALLAKHWPMLHGLGLVTDEAPRIYRQSATEPGTGAGTVYIEIFSWKSGHAPEEAHQNPQVRSLWEPMGALCEEMEFPHFERIDLRLAPATETGDAV